MFAILLLIVKIDLINSEIIPLTENDKIEAVQVHNLWRKNANATAMRRMVRNCSTNSFQILYFKFRRNGTINWLISLLILHPNAYLITLRSTNDQKWLVSITLVRIYSIPQHR